MIRRALRGVARRVLGRGEGAPQAAPPTPPPAPRVDAAPVQAPDEPPADEPEVEVEAATLARWVREEGRPVVFLDIREPHEVMQTHLRDAILLPMNRVPEQLQRLPRDRTLIVYCAAGARSYGVAHFLREQGFAEAWSLAGGIGAWVEEGGAYEQPVWETRLRPTMTVRLGPAACAAHGLATGTTGSVQAVRRVDGEIRVVVDVPRPDGWLRLPELPEADLG